MAKKWKAYPWPDRNETIEVEDEEEIDVVGDSPANKQAAATCWGPSSPTAGATAPSPPPHSPKGSTILYNGEFHFSSLITCSARFTENPSNDVSNLLSARAFDSSNPPK